MVELNIEFQERYKELDKLCKDTLSTGDGVSAYINEMDLTPYQDRRFATNWNMIYNNLKHVRHMRNKLAHELDIYCDYCKRSDIDIINNFYYSILETSDPLSVVRRTKLEIAKLERERERQRATVNYERNAPKQEPLPQKKSLWNRIAALFCRK